MQTFSEADLIINPDGSIYHLALRPGQVADTIITVGDPYRVQEVSKHFDRIEHRISHREFVTHTGYLNNKRLTVISTGIGTDNVDIVLNELDALVNLDFTTRSVKKEITSLQIIRLGTSGAVDETLPVDSIIISEHAIGLDGLMHYYEYTNNIQETVYVEAFTNHVKSHLSGTKPYIATADEKLLQQFESYFRKGTTLTAAGFYAPQGRLVRAPLASSGFLKAVHSFRHKHFRITNLEMETAGIYGLGKLLGHRCLSISAILANRIQGQFSKEPQKSIERLITQALDIITSLP
ncbi:MAG: nucleoside phosphorylase [Chitinophagales bacterium]|nr:nucleoside phosphorylase [Chitinophagales bacterium]MDW8418146.1 nucleoside phosphorylase [Chitinophagales bacterium]